MKIELKTSKTFDGDIKAGPVSDFLAAVPSDATVNIRVWDNQMDGHGAELTVLWEEDR